MSPCGLRAEETPAGPADRPVPKTNRWAEDWSALRDPALRTQPFDDLKYIPLLATDPQSYLSLGLTLRERFESNRTPGFGVGGVRGDAYLLQRLQIHLDARLSENWQIFAQVEDARAFDKRTITSVDENILDLRLAFLSYSRTVESGTFKARAGRQDFAFDLQRFVSSRDGPNVRQSFDALWADWETESWRLLGFISQPVQYRFAEPFDDFSNRGLRFSTLRVERKVLGDNELSAYWGLYQRDGARFLDAGGNEARHVFDVRFAGAADGFDWDLEAMGQLGRVGSSAIRAWAVGSRVGYTFASLPLQPRLGLQADAASGDRRRDDATLGTFNPLFPNGYYFTLAGYTGYANLLHLKPSLTIRPVAGLAVTAALGLQWRETTADAVYVQPSNPVPGTAGRGHPWTGAYGQLRADYVFAPGLTGAVEAVRFAAGDTIREAGGKDATYLGLELRYAW
nr:alginate export family protein [Methylobacterium nodulans]